ncbi:conserved hypothetical protein [Candidatus Desulfarcum epimagneticum]|uniref:DUF4258 domain-containing protein n=1 Tax=uncultured Desulfobacteraceae bacterium TaxID=218296 RepID=A0A484HK72_9BACT|nr:conserved hypothetical protein [uncultured Desulfobacteraceae bacterium]
MEDTVHFQDMLKERGIKREWADLAVLEPDRTEEHVDGTRHYIRRIEEYGNRWLRVVVNVSSEPHKRVTAFFDRRLRRAK